MPDTIVSFAAIQRQAEKAAAAGRCPQSACLWPPESAAAQIFHQQFHALQAARGAVHGNLENSHV